MTTQENTMGEVDESRVALFETIEEKYRTESFRTAKLAYDKHWLAIEKMDPVLKERQKALVGEMMNAFVAMVGPNAVYKTQVKGMDLLMVPIVENKKMVELGKMIVSTFCVEEGSLACYDPANMSIHWGFNKPVLIVLTGVFAGPDAKAKVEAAATFLKIGKIDWKAVEEQSRKMIDISNNILSTIGVGA